MKVGIFIGESDPDHGGSFTFESQILKALLKHGLDCKHHFILFGSLKNESKYNYLNRHIKIYPIDLFFGERLRVRFFNCLNLIFRTTGCKKFYIDIEGYKNNLVEKKIMESGVDIIWSLKQTTPTMEIPYVITLWDLEHRTQAYFPEVSNEGIWDAREKHFGTNLRRATTIVTGTKIGKSEIIFFYQVPEERIKVLPFPTPNFSLKENFLNEDIEILTKYDIPENYLFYPAQFWPHKNHVGLLLSVQILKEKYQINFPVVFVGSDKVNKNYIKRFAEELDLSEQTHFLGFVPREDLIRLYRRAFALTYVTFFGPDNIPPLEAFALGCPVIASKVSGAHEQFENAAILVDPKNPEEIASAINTLFLKPHERKLLISRGYDRTLKFSEKDYINSLISIIDEFEPFRRCWE